MSSTYRHLLLDFFWQVISGSPCIDDDLTNEERKRQKKFRKVAREERDIEEKG
jgi:hypothetical protein